MAQFFISRNRNELWSDNLKFSKID